MTLQITWSLVEVDRCRSCHHTTVLWTNSHAHRFNQHMPLIACADCYKRQANFDLQYVKEIVPYDYPTGQKFAKAVLELIENTAPVDLDESQYPYLATLFKCDSCKNYIAEGKEVLGVRQDNLAPLRLHYHCSTEASCCGRTYASRYAVESGMYATLTQINGDIKCQICLDEYLRRTMKRSTTITSTVTVAIITNTSQKKPSGVVRHTVKTATTTMFTHVAIVASRFGTETTTIARKVMEDSYTITDTSHNPTSLERTIKSESLWALS